MLWHSISENVQDLCDSIELFLENWKQGKYCFINIKNDIHFWTANGLEYLKLNNTDCFNIREKKLIWNSIKNVNVMNASRVK